MSPFHPWRLLRQMGERVEVVWEYEPGRMGSWCQASRTLRIDPLLTQAERRCTAAHEAIHAERGDTACDPSVHKEAARRLITIEDLADAALIYEDDHHALAEYLWVDEDTLQNRLEHLHPSERGYLTRRLSMKEHTA